MQLNDGFRVIVQEETPLFRAHAVLFDLEKLGVKVSDFVTFERHSLPVMYINPGRVTSGTIGSAGLYMSDKKIQALISLDYHTPERFDLQLDNPVYVTPVGSYYLRGTDLVMDYVDINFLYVTSEPRDQTSVLVHRI
jgi:hypothetical protein